MTSTTRRFGAYDMTTLADGLFLPPLDVLIHAGGEAARLALAERLAGQQLQLDVNCFLLRGPGGTALIDSGMGSSWGEAFGQARTALAQAGVAPEQISRVLLTHLHIDHALGLLEGETAWLPNAEIFIPTADLAYFTDSAARASLPEERRDTFDLTTKLLTAYAGRIHTLTHGAVPGMTGVELLPLPGHTPGHSGYLVHGAETLLIWADTVHVRDEQLADPAIGLVFDTDAAQAYQTRLHLLDMAASQGWTVAGSHINGFGRIERAASAYRFAPR